MCTIGTAGMRRSFARKGWDCVAIAYRCLFVSPVQSINVRTMNGPIQGPTHDTSQTVVSRNGLSVVALATLECLCNINSSLLNSPLQIELVNAALSNHCDHRNEMCLSLKKGMANGRTGLDHSLQDRCQLLLNIHIRCVNLLTELRVHYASTKPSCCTRVRART
jgi:hypothetical protein